MRDKLIGLAFVAVVAGLIWFIGSRMREHHVAPALADGAPAPVAVADAEADTSASAELDAGALANGEAEATPDASAACLAMRAASQRKIDDATDAGWCVDESTDELGCATSPNGATWGLRIDDVTDIEPDAAGCPTGWLVRVVHDTADGGEQTVVPPGPGGVRNGHPYNVYKSAPVYVVTFFDFDGDGEDEAVIGRWTDIFVWTFKHGKIARYAPTSGFTIDEVKDIDNDGRPDLLIRPFGDAPTTLQLYAHSLPDGAFTIRDAVAVQHAQSACPTDAPVPLPVDGGGVADDVLANDIACSLLWGHDPKALSKDLCTGNAAPCAAWVKRMLATKPPLSLR